MWLGGWVGEGRGRRQSCKWRWKERGRERAKLGRFWEGHALPGFRLNDDRTPSLPYFTYLPACLTLPVSEVLCCLLQVDLPVLRRRRITFRLLWTGAKRVEGVSDFIYWCVYLTSVCYWTHFLFVFGFPLFFPGKKRHAHSLSLHLTGRVPVRKDCVCILVLHFLFFLSFFFFFFFELPLFCLEILPVTKDCTRAL